MSENPHFKSQNQFERQAPECQVQLQKLPSTINAAINRITQLIKPPAPNESLNQKLSQAAENYKSSMRHIVDEHLVDQYTSNQRALAQLDATDCDHANIIVKNN